MKKHFHNTAIFALLLIFTAQACAQNDKKVTETQLNEDIVYTEQDAEIFADIISKFKDDADKPINVLIPEIGKYFLGNDYVAFTLEVEEDEKLILNLRELDCTTYAENLFALARTLKSENQTFQQFAREIENIRYRDGLRDEYPSRLHYFSDWIYNNKDNGLVTTPADEIGDEYPTAVHFMSTNPDKYKHLNNNPDYVSVIAEQEKEINGSHYFYIPREEIVDHVDLLKEGDIIGLTTSLDGLDVSHVGVLVKVDDKLHLMHASQSSMKVEISEEPIEHFLKPNSTGTGIMVARPVG